MEDQEVVHHLPDAEPDSLARRKIKNDRVVHVGACSETHHLTNLYVAPDFTFVFSYVQ